jgi:hypothetical protein
MFQKKSLFYNQSGYPLCFPIDDDFGQFATTTVFAVDLSPDVERKLCHLFSPRLAYQASSYLESGKGAAHM